MQEKFFQSFNVEAGNKLAVFAISSAAHVMVSAIDEPFVSRSAIAHGQRPKDVPLSTANYGKLTSSPMGNVISAIIRLPKDMASKQEFMHQIDLLYSLYEDGRKAQSNL